MNNMSSIIFVWKISLGQLQLELKKKYIF